MDKSFSSEPFFTERLRQHDEKAISYLYEHYKKVFSNIVFKILASHCFWSSYGDYEELIKDLIQDIVIRVCCGIQRFDASKGNLSAWLCIVARNTALDFCKNKKNDFNYRHLSRGQLIDSTVGNNRMMEALEIANKMDICVAVQKIEPRLYAVFHLVYIEGYSATEAAGILQIPIGTVKTRMRLGRSIVKKYLQKDRIAVNYLLNREYGSGT